MSPLRLTSTAMTLCALGFSVAAHAAVLVAWGGPFGHAGAAPVAARSDDDAVVVDVIEPVPPEPESPVTTAANRAARWPTHTHPYPVPADHDATPHDPSVVHAHAQPPALEAPAAAAPAITANDDPPTFTIALGPAGGASFGAVSATGTATPHVASPPVLSEQGVDTRARLVHGHAPSYPPAAREDGIEGDVRLELIVDDSGVVQTARVVRGIGHGLDEAAVQAVRQFRFAPATKDGHAVRVRMAWSMQFRLQ